MKKRMNSGKPYIQTGGQLNMVILSQAHFLKDKWEGAETIPQGSTSDLFRVGWKRPPSKVPTYRDQDDDIVHALRKLKDSCNRRVSGSNPDGGAIADWHQTLPLIGLLYSPLPLVRTLRLREALHL